MRASWADGPWSFQVSGGHLKTPESKSPYNQDRVTASASFFRGDERRSLAWTAAFGQNREVFGNLEAYLFEVTRRSGKNAGLRTRRDGGEGHSRRRLSSGRRGATHRQSQIGAITAGYLRDVAAASWGAFGIGGDITGYYVPDNLSESYGSPVSFHVFLRYRGRAGVRLAHVTR